MNKAGISDNFNAGTSSLDNGVRQIGRFKNIRTRKSAIKIAPSSPALLTTDANQFDVRVDPNPTPSPHVESTAFQAVVFQNDLS